MNYTNVYYHFRKHLLNLKTSFGKRVRYEIQNEKQFILNVNGLI